MHIIRTLPQTVYVALSGGIDSVVLFHFLRKKYNVIAVHHVHDNEYAQKELEFVEELCNKTNTDLLVNKVNLVKNPKDSKEEAWRKSRYEYFRQVDGTVCTGHTLDDMVEWYLFTAMHGEGRFMEYAHANVVRPFICTKKEEIIDFANKNNISWLEDPSNLDINFAVRNRIRHEILPSALLVNPGLYKTVKTKFLKKLQRQLSTNLKENNVSGKISI